MPVRLDWFTVHARSFDGIGTVEVLVPQGYLEKLFTTGPTRKYYDADVIPDVLRSPKLIIEGLERAEFEHAYRYYGTPKYRWNGHMEELPPANKVFVVYVAHSEEKESLVVLDWDWVPEHGTLPGYPQCYKEGS